MELTPLQREELKSFSCDQKVYSNRILNKGVPTRFWVIGKAPEHVPRYGIQFKKTEYGNFYQFWIKEPEMPALHEEDDVEDNDDIEDIDDDDLDGIGDDDIDDQPVASVPATPPSFWDTWAMNKAKELAKQIEQGSYPGVQFNNYAHIHCALIEAMEFVTKKAK